MGPQRTSFLWRGVWVKVTWFPLSSFSWPQKASMFWWSLYMSDNHFFHGYKVGSNVPMVISHLEFAEDTLIIAEKSWVNVRAMRVVLILFEAISGLKVNFTKSRLIGVNVQGSWLTEAALVLKCKVGTLPFVYLGCL